MTTNAMGDIVYGSIVTLPEDNIRYIVGEIFDNGYCRLYNLVTNEYKGLFAIEEIKDYVG